jgi:PKD repeat protein
MGAPPVASFTTAQAASPPLTTTFTDTSTNSPTSWSWNFGDGATSTAQSPAHTYAAAGTYTVTLTASNSGGSGTTTQSATVVAAPVAGFTTSPPGGLAPLPVTFTDTSTNSPTSWSWNFGDGTTSTAQNPTHTYSTFGNYGVTLTVTNAGGISTTVPTTIAVTDFALTASPSSQSVVRGGSVKYQVTLTPKNGFNDSVLLSVRGLGSGATASFAPNPTSSSAVLTISTTTTAKNGTFTLTIDGVSGKASRSTTVTLQIKRN